jgi:hypothetical protein
MAKVGVLLELIFASDNRFSVEAFDNVELLLIRSTNDTRSINVQQDIDARIMSSPNESAYSPNIFQ